jgi:hypothetical protein
MTSASRLVDTRLEHRAGDETVERLCNAPSVGPVIAAAFSSTVDDAQTGVP